MNGTLLEYQARASMLQPAPMDILAARDLIRRAAVLL
jgi:hypothetical protein